MEHPGLTEGGNEVGTGGAMELPGRKAEATSFSGKDFLEFNFLARQLLFGWERFEMSRADQEEAKGALREDGFKAVSRSGISFRRRKNSFGSGDVFCPRCPPPRC